MIEPVYNHLGHPLPAKKLYCKHCGKRLTSRMTTLEFDEYTGARIEGPRVEICANKSCPTNRPFPKAVW